MGGIVISTEKPSANEMTVNLFVFFWLGLAGRLLPVTVVIKADLNPSL